MGNGTSIGRVRALGSAHSGSHHWLLQRFTAMGNLVLLAYLLTAFALLPDLSYMVVRHWIAQPLPATAVALLVISSFWHAKLGLQVVVEDYVHDHANKFAALAALNLAAFGGAAFGVFSIIRIALGAA
ncbi:MAG: succinate dehydrogenase, hydrophobic membrane anchor protein [Novosphingobium sp.]